MNALTIAGGRVVDPVSGHDRPADVHVAGDRIVAIGAAPADHAPDEIIDATGLVVCPGLIDLAARLREPGFEYRATLESEMAAAIAGGVTSLACPPDTDPPLDEPGLVEMLKFRARSLNRARVYPVGALTLGLRGERITEMAELTDAGCVAFSQADAPLADTGVLMRTMQYAATFGFPVWLRAQDPHLARDGVAHDGEVATRLGLAGIPVCAETIALDTILALAQATGARVHICRVSSAEGVARIARARADGLPVTCDVSINHLHLCEVDIGYFDSNCHLVPPLRSVRDRDALRAGVARGTIDAIVSDHTPVDDDAKHFPFAEAEPGATGLELLLPLTLKWASESGVPLARALGRITSDAARVLGIDAGRLAPGAVADLVVFDPVEEWVVSPQSLLSQGRNTPFSGLAVLGRVRATLVGGQPVFRR